MKKILSVVGVAVITALAGYAISYLQQPGNYARVLKATKRYTAKLEKSASDYSKKTRRLLSKKLKEYNL